MEYSRSPSSDAEMKLLPHCSNWMYNDVQCTSQASHILDYIDQQMLSGFLTRPENCPSLLILQYSIQLVVSDPLHLVP